MKTLGCWARSCAATKTDAQSVQTTLTTALRSRIWVQQYTSIRIHDVLRQHAQRVAIPIVPVHRERATKVNRHVLRIHRRDLLPGPLARIADELRQVIDRLLKAATLRGLIVPKIDAELSADFCDARQRLDVESAVVHRARALHLERLLTGRRDLPPDTRLRFIDELPRRRRIADKHRQ